MSSTARKQPRWRFVLTSTLRSFTADGCSDLAAGLTYYTVMAIFPALLAIVSILGIVGQAGPAVDAMMRIIRQVAPGDAADIIGGIVRGMAAQGGAGIALVIGILLALWSASGYVGGFGRMMNRIYRVREGRPTIKLRLVNLLVTLVIVLAFVVALVLLVASGPVLRELGAALGLGATFLKVFNIVKWPILVIVLIGVVALLYYATPNVKYHRFRLLSLGAVLAIVGCGLGSVAFAVYVANFANYNKTYGALGGVIVLLLWLYLTNTLLLLGAELDAELERTRELAHGLPAEEHFQLPLRDDTQIEKLEAKDDDWRLQAAILRERGLRKELAKDAGEFFESQGLDDDGFVRDEETR